MTQAPQAPTPLPPGVPQAAGTRRPGGLTALAVLNFVFGGLGIIGLFGTFALLSAASTIAREVTGGKVSVPGAGAVYLSLFLGLVASALLIVSGVGYLGQKKVTGKLLGNVYAIVAIINVIVGLVMVHSGFGFFAIIGLAYPIVTLALLNTTFARAFIN
jgi:hypothetical protein